MECRLCRKAVNAGAEMNQHDECSAEWERRSDAGSCTLCGSNRAAGSGSWCNECIASGNPSYRGYPGSG